MPSNNTIHRIQFRPRQYQTDTVTWSGRISSTEIKSSSTVTKSSKDD